MHKINLLLSFFILVSTLSTFAQDEKAISYSEKIDTMRLKSIISTLTQEEYLGRKTSNEGISLSANYLAKEFESNKIKGGNKQKYKQSIEAYNKNKANKYFNFSNYNYSTNYHYENTPQQDSVIEGNQVVFAGYGIYNETYNDFANVDISNKIVLVLKGDGPTTRYGVKKHSARNIPSYDYFDQQKPKAVLIIEPGFNNYSNYTSRSLTFFSSRENRDYPVIKINELLANRILEKVNKTVKQLSFEYEAHNTSLSLEFEAAMQFNGNKSYELADVNNVVGFIEGSDLKDEYIVLTAHYDHIGQNYQKQIYPGADDNASGVAAVMEIARVLNQAKKEGHGPRRSVVVLLTTAEEDGLKGAQYYLHNPLFPLEKTTACINIDMLGRMSSKASKEEISQGYVHALTGYSSPNDTLSALVDTLNAQSTQLAITEKSSSFYRRSDHYEFHQQGIPSIFFTNGEHSDLHRTSDTEDKIEYSPLRKRSQLVFITLWHLANSDFKKDKTS